MIFIETKTFTKRITALMSDEEYREVQVELIHTPTKGKIIKGSKGLRKLRCQASGRGKRGGARIIYYYMVDEVRVHMLLAYSKNEQEYLTKDQIKILSKLMQEELL